MSDDHIEHFEAALRNSRRIDRAKAIRQEQQCSFQEAVAFERREFEAAKGSPLMHELSIAGYLRIEGGRLLTPDEKQAIIAALQKAEQIGALSSVNDELRQRIGLGEAENERLERIITKLQAALRQIADWCPATQEMTLAHEMAQEAEDALEFAAWRS